MLHVSHALRCLATTAVGAVAVSGGLVLVPASLPVAHADMSKTVTYGPTGSWHVFDPPDYATSVVVDVQGAAGGDGTTQCQTSKALGGKGGRVQTRLSVSPGETLGIWVGAKGVDSDGLGGAGGGMASVIYSGNDLLAIAGAGGGAYCLGGGAGGGLAGGYGSGATQGSPAAGGGAGGTQTGGGSGGTPGDGASWGGSGAAWTLSGGGQGVGGGGCRPGSNGGAGWFGGGGGGGGSASVCGAGGSGGGGSSWTRAGRATAVVHTQGYRAGGGVVSITWVAASCDDGLDNDGDGKVDYPNDPGCTGPSDSTEPDPKCSDGIDNDADGKVDYPADPGCTNRQDDSEGGCPPLTSDPVVMACLTPTTVVDRYTAVTPSVDPGPTVQVAGYLDNYRFMVGGTSVTLPCVTLVANSTVRPCAQAGGTFVSRVSVLVDQSHAVPGVTLPPAIEVAVCNAELSLTVNGTGINSMAAYALC